MMEPTGRVVVGVDGSEQAALAASWAADDAQIRRRPLHLVVVNNDPAHFADAEQTLDDLAERCRARSPQVCVTEEIASGHPAEVLIGRCAQANLIAVGARGLGGFTGTLLGSVSTAVATHSSCPVVVVRNQTSGTAPVLVGLDTFPASRPVLEFALEAAAARKLGLVAMQLWQRAEHDDVFATPIPLPSPEDVQQTMQRRLAEQVAGYSDQYPDVRVRKVAQRGHPVSGLTEASRNAELLVVGHRGRGGFTGMLLGSVATGVLHHAHCPVAVVRIPKPND